MLLKALAVVKSKLGAHPVLGALVLASVGSAVALAAAQGHLGGVGAQMSSRHGDTGKPDDRAHAEGKLTACDAPAGAISVTDAQRQTHSFSVAATTRFNGDIDDGSAHTASDTQDKASSSAGAALGFGLKDLCPLVNKITVQVQATGTTSGSTTTLTAAKVTVQGADGARDNGPEPTEAPKGVSGAGDD